MIKWKDVNFALKILKSRKQHNRCHECGCKCTCFKSCEGDFNKCTSRKAIEKGCNHHCDCHLGILAENIRRYSK